VKESGALVANGDLRDEPERIMGIGDEAVPNPPLDAPAHGVALALHPAAIERLGDDGAVLVAAIFDQRGAVLRLLQQAARVIPEALDILRLVARPRARREALDARDPVGLVVAIDEPRPIGLHRLDDTTAGVKGVALPPAIEVFGDGHPVRKGRSMCSKRSIRGPEHAANGQDTAVCGAGVK
jgi:hypothetical protein